VTAREDPLTKRYAFKLFANIAGVAVSVVTQSIIPRGLGPKAYGDFNFLTNVFMQFAGFLDMGAGTAFYTKLSRRPRDAGLVRFYLCFTGVVSLLMAAGVLFAHLTSSYSWMLPGQHLFYIYLALAWGISAWILQVLGNMADAYGATVPAESARVLQKGLGLGLILALFLAQQLTLPNLFYSNYLLFFVLGCAFIWVIRRRGYPLGQDWRLSAEQAKGYAKEFYQYAHPLFTYICICFIVGILDRWLLQSFAGSIEQGFYGLSFQISTFCFLFTGAMTPLLTREFSIAFENRDLAQMKALFRRYIPFMYSVAAYFSCFAVLQADKIIFVMGGSEYSGAQAAVTVMAFYPIHQTYGQLSGSLFFSTGQTVLYRNIGILFTLIGLPMTYFLIAPPAKMGLGAGATGLAVKMVAIQLVGVNVQLYFNARFLKLPFWHYVRHQFLSVACFLVLAAIATVSLDAILGAHAHITISLVLAGLFYTVMALGLVYCVPALSGLDREHMGSVLKKLWGYR
jgi:O-antigen/teichoic acid export membrane protein